MRVQLFLVIAYHVLDRNQPYHELGDDYFARRDAQAYTSLVVCAWTGWLRRGTRTGWLRPLEGSPRRQGNPVPISEWVLGLCSTGISSVPMSASCAAPPCSVASVGGPVPFIVLGAIVGALLLGLLAWFIFRLPR